MPKVKRSRATRLERWLTSKPAIVRELTHRFPPWSCYRLKTDGGNGHYKLYSVEEHQDGPATFKIEHLPGSFGYNVGAGPHGEDVAYRVFGIDPEDLVPCGCVLAKKEA